MWVLGHQAIAMLRANMKARYRNSWAGFLWVLLNPILLFGAQSFVFHSILKINVPNYFLFLLSGLLPWLFITQSLEMTTNIFVSSGRLLKGFQIQPAVCLLAQILDNFFNFVVLFALMLTAAVILGHLPPARALLFAVPVLICLIGVVGLAWLLATLQVFYRDVKFVTSFVLNVSFFMTPIFYPENFVDPQYRWLLLLNPFRYFILPFRDLIEGASAAFITNCLVALTLSLALLVLAAANWRQRRNVAYFYI
jgi:ABC-type polysaccharide/polyol phosphate export permease